MKIRYTSRCPLIFSFIFIFCTMPLNKLHSSGPIEVWPAEIFFDFEEGNANDAITVSTLGETINTAEWLDANQVSVPAYIRNQTNRKIRVVFSSNYSGLTHLILKLTVTTGNGLGEVCNLFIPNCTIGSPVDISLTGALPDRIGKKEFTWKWEIYGIPSDLTNYYPAWKTSYSSHSYYTLLDTPKAPMAVPWVEVLEYACSWANQQIYDDYILSQLTSHLYYSGFTYHGGWHYTSNNMFNLSGLILNIESQSSIQMDCRDFSNFLLALANSLGMDVQYNKIGYNFRYCYLLPAGFSTSVYDQVWTFHQVAWYNSGVADASTQLDFDISPISIPNQWKLCVGDVSFEKYLEKLTYFENVDSVEIGICSVY